MGMFDDLIPAKTDAPSASGGMFDDLIPKKTDGPAEAPKISFDRPIADVRADIAKIPEGPQRDAAMKQWADAYVAKERGAQAPADDKTTWIGPVGWGPQGPAARSQPITDLIRNFAKGTLVGSFADELNAATSAGLHKVTGGAAGAPYDEAVAYQRAVDRAIAKEDPVGSTATQVAGALASGAPIAKAVMGTAKTLPGKIAQGGVLGPTYGYVAGFGEGEGDAEQRHEKATSAEGSATGLSPVEMGLLGGLVLPPAVTGVGNVVGKAAEAASPTIARVAASAKELPRRMGISASADGAVPETAGARAAAEQMIANQLSRAGVSVDDLRKRLLDVDEATKFHSSGQAQNVTALADIDPSLQRLAGSAGRASPEAGNVAKTFIESRQTGRAPTPEDAAQIASSAGLPTRQRLAPPMTAEQSMRTLGSDFAAGEKNLVPMGQGERLVDGLKRALRIKDSDFHGHAANANRTDDAIMAAAREEAKPAYDALYKAGDNINIGPVVRDVLAKWAPDGDKLAREPEPVKAMVQKLARLFAPGGQPITHIEKFDKTKQYADGVIEKLFSSVEGRNRHAGKVLTDFKNDMLAGLDNLKTNNLGAIYKDARGKFSSRMESRDALQAGRDAFKAETDAGVDAFRAYAGNDGHEKLFRLGILGEAEKQVSRMKHGADKTQIFDNPRIEALLSEVIERSKRSSAEFAKRPERFGQFVGNEKRMVGTRDAVLGNSATAQRLKDDETYNVMSRFSETVENFKSSGSLTMLGIRAAEQALSKVFGMRADTASSIARQLFTADPRQRERVLMAVEQRLGKNRFEQLQRLMEEHQRKIAAVGARQTAMPEAQQ